MQDFFTIFGLAFIGSVAGLVGGVIFLFKKTWARALSLYAIPFAAGVLLSVSFLDLLPQATQAIGDQAFTVVLIIFVILFLFERFLFSLHHHKEENSTVKNAVPLVIAGDTIHNFLDGVAIAAAYIVEPKLGLVVALAAFLHETPHEIADFGILLSAGWNRQKAFVANFLSALSTFPGAFLAVLFARQAEEVTGIFIGIAAGLFLYVAATDFLPEAKEKAMGNPLYQGALLVAGALIIFVLTRFLEA